MSEGPSRTAQAARRRLGVVVLVVALTAVGCAGSAGPSDRPTPGAGPGVFDAGAGARVFLPPADTGVPAGPVPVVVLVPGGGWSSADPAGLAPLAQYLGGRGAAVVTVTYRTSSDGAYFPLPVQDVGCDVAYAAARVRDAGLEVGEVVLVGHSAGAQLAAVVALRPGDSPGCVDPPVTVDRVVGLAGPYDVTQVPQVAVALFGPDRQDPSRWADGNPLGFADERPEVPVLLIHGRADDVVPLALSEEFAAALEAGGHEVTTRYPDGEDHRSVYQAAVAGPLIADWLGLPAG